MATFPQNASDRQWLGYGFDPGRTAEILVGKFVNQYLSVITLTYASTDY